MSDTTGGGCSGSGAGGSGVGSCNGTVVVSDLAMLPLVAWSVFSNCGAIGNVGDVGENVDNFRAREREQENRDWIKLDRLSIIIVTGQPMLRDRSKRALRSYRDCAGESTKGTSQMIRGRITF